MWEAILKSHLSPDPFLMGDSFRIHQGVFSQQTGQIIVALLLLSHICLLILHLNYEMPPPLATARSKEHKY